MRDARLFVVLPVCISTGGLFEAGRFRQTEGPRAGSQQSLMTEGLSRSMFTPGAPGPSRGTDRALVSLVDTALSRFDLEATLAAVAGWWVGELPSRPFAIGIADEFGLRTLIAVASGTATPEVAAVDRCHGRESVSLRETVAGCLECPEADWYPLADGGRVFGGMAVGAARNPGRGATVPPLWIDLTARLLAEAARRETRLREEKLAALAEFAAGAGHEINNPLGSILGRVQLLSREESHPERRRSLATIGAQALRVRDMIGDAMLFARPPAPQPVPVDCSSIVDAAVRCCEEEWRTRGITLAGNRDRAVPLYADPAQAAVVMNELLRNATHAAPEGSEIRVEVGCLTTGSQSLAVVEVADQGDGLSPVDLRHLFDPFYSGRQAGRGLGFGLSKCWRIVARHGGCLHAENARPGVRITVHWPTPAGRQLDGGLSPERS